jgi:hypothetical protein
MVMKAKQIFNWIIFALLISQSLTWDYTATIGEITAYTDTGGVFAPSVAKLSSGDKYVITWYHQASSTLADCFYSVYDSTGKALKSKVIINATTDNHTQPKVAADNNGGFVVVWALINSASPTQMLACYFSSAYVQSTMIRIDDISPPTRSLSNIPGIGFTGKYFFVCFNQYYSGSNSINIGQYLQVSGTTLQKVGTNVVIGDTAAPSGNNESNCRVAPLGGGTGDFIFSFYSYYIGTSLVENVKLALMNENTQPLVAPSSFTTYAGGQSGHSVSKLETTAGAFVFTWIDYNGSVYTPYMDVFANYSTKLSSKIVITATANVMLPDVKSLGSDGFIVIYRVNVSGYKVYYQLFNNDGTKNGGTERVICTACGIMNAAFVASTYNSSIGVAYVNTPAYNTYVRILNRTATPVTCYMSCSTCSGAGEIVNHLCTACQTGYYYLEDNATFCYNASYPPTGYFLGTSIWKKCYNLCKACTAYPTDPTTNMFCTSNSCIATYYPKEDNMTSCFQSPVNQYYFDSTTSMFKKCYNLCTSCTGYPTNPTTNMLCSSCIASYYPKVDNATSCFQSPVSQYYLDSSNIWQKCYNLCNACTGYPTDPTKDMLCSSNSCISSYYPKEDNMTSCFQNTILQYYFDTATSIYKKCYSSCKSCTGFPTDSSKDMLCSTCIASYYPKEDYLTSCFTDPVLQYYFDSANSIYKKCYSSCKSCTGFPTDSTKDMLCSTCITSYYPKEDYLTSCFTDPVNQYYLDKTTNVYKKCYNLCKTCTGLPTDPTADMSCSTCIASYYPKEDKLTSCFKDTIDQYHLDITANMYKKCYTSCKSCTGYPPNPTTDMLCSSCVSNFYPKSDNLTSCFTGTQSGYNLAGTIYQKIVTSTTDSTSPSADTTSSSINPCPNAYYHKEDDYVKCYTGVIPGYFLYVNLYHKCYNTCQACKKLGTFEIQECDACIEGYYPKVDNPTSCFIDPVNNYYLKDNIYQKCYPSCLTCTTIGTDIDHKCTACETNYYPKIDNMTSCFTGFQDPYYLNSDNIYAPCDTCKIQCPLLSAYDAVTNSCVNCKDGEVVYKEKCTANCPIGYIKDKYTCTSCSDSHLKYYNHQCVKDCPENTIYNSLTNICEDICESGFKQEGVGCISCASIDKYYYTNQCVDDCPSNTIKIKSMCQPYLSITCKINLI